MKSQGARRRILLGALILLALSGLLLHMRVHPFSVQSKELPGMTVYRWSFLWATFFPLLDVVLVTALFLSRRTAVYGYVLNGFLVIYGTVLMGDFSLADLVGRSAPAAEYLFKSTLPDIGIAWADFLVGALLWEALRKEPASIPGPPETSAQGPGQRGAVASPGPRT